MKFEACVKCGKDLIPAPAKFDGEPTFVGYLPHDCTPVKECLQQILTMQENNLPSVDEIKKKIFEAVIGIDDLDEKIESQSQLASLKETWRNGLARFATILTQKNDEIQQLEKQRDHYKALAEATERLFQSCSGADLDYNGKFYAEYQSLKIQTP